MWLVHRAARAHELALVVGAGVDHAAALAELVKCRGLQLSQTVARHYKLLDISPRVAVVRFRLEREGRKMRKNR